jgi:P27 family predicted phage terminase small subunit
MVKTPPLSIVSGETVGVSPPRKLEAYGTALWNRVQAEYGIADTGGIELLAQACAALDRAESLAEAIARDGPVIYTRNGAPKSHPAVKDELALRAFITRTLERLGLNVESIRPGPGRPPSPSGWRPDLAS